VRSVCFIDGKGPAVNDVLVDLEEGESQLALFLFALPLNVVHGDQDLHDLLAEFRIEDVE